MCLNMPKKIQHTKESFVFVLFEFEYDLLKMCVICRKRNSIRKSFVFVLQINTYKPSDKKIDKIKDLSDYK